MEVKGRHVIEGKPTTVVLRDGEVREALAEPVRQVVQAVRDALERIPPELSADVCDTPAGGKERDHGAGAGRRIAPALRRDGNHVGFVASQGVPQLRRCIVRSWAAWTAPSDSTDVGAERCDPDARNRDA